MPGKRSILSKVYEERSVERDDDTELSIVATNVFFRNLESKKQIVINRGGAGSGKSHGIAQLLLYKFFNEEKKKIFIYRKAQPALRLSCYQVMNELVDEYNLRGEILEEKVHMNWYYDGSMIHFGGFDDPEKVKCYHPDTEILTREGWKKIGDVKKGELVATMDPETRQLFYKPAIRTFSYDYDGDMVAPSSQNGEKRSGVDFLVTPNHKMLVHRKDGDPLVFKEAKDCKGGFKYARYGILNEGEKPEFFEIKGLKYSDKEYRKRGRKPLVFPIVPFLKLLGWYLSEGATNGKYMIVICQEKVVGREQIKEDLEDFPYPCIERDIGFVLHGKDLAHYFFQFGKSKDRFIPEDVKRLHPSLLTHLLDTLIKGDGRWEKNGRWSYGTTSKRLADDIAEIAVKLGYTVGGHIQKTLTSKGNKVWYIRGCPSKDTSASVIKKVPYKGKVYCMEVPPYNTLVSRYSQVVVITGNSSQFNYAWMEEATGFTYDDFQRVRLCLREPSRDGIKNQMFLSFNPIDEFHWIKKKVIDEPSYASDIEEIHSTYRDNPFLLEDNVKVLQGYERQDVSYYNIYTLGNWGRLENQIYKNWDETDWVPDISTMDKVCYGMDFGFNDPTVLVKLSIQKKEVWVEELLYHVKLDTSELIQKMQQLIPTSEQRRTQTIYADPTEPEKIDAIKKAGFSVKPAIRSLNPGIDTVKSYWLKVYSGADHILKELRSYSWKKDKNDNVTDDPIGGNDHACVSGDTIIHTVGGDVPIKELVGKEGLVYSFDFDRQRIAAKKFSDVCITKKNAEMVKLYLDDGSSLKLTKDHPVLLKTGEWREAGKLIVSDSLMPFYTKSVNYGDNIYSMVSWGGKENWKYNHRLIYEDCVGELPENTLMYNVHHRDGNSMNNVPSNLELVTRAQHASIHKRGIKYSDEKRELFSKAMQRLEQTRSPEYIEKRANHLKRIGKLTKEWHGSKEGKEWHRKHWSKSIGKYIGQQIVKVCEFCGEEYSVCYSQQKRSKFCSITCGSKGYRKLRFEKYGMSDKERRKKGIIDERSLSPFVDSNPCVVCGKVTSVRKNILKRKLFCSLECRKKATFSKENHKVVFIRHVGREDVYNMYVEGTHNFAASGIYLHNCDSIRYALHTVTRTLGGLRVRFL